MLIQIKKDKTVVREYNISNINMEDAKEWGNKQIKASKLEGCIVEVTNVKADD